MKPLLLVMTLALCSHAACAADPQVDQDAILRLGNLVQYVGDGVRANPDVDAFVEAMAPPENDSDKWFISVLTSPGCAPCAQLKQAWKTSAALKALANPADPKESWAHYNEYDASDQSQQFRFANVKVSAYPTILVQPPRTGRYGDPATIVFQRRFQNDPDKLARDITAAIRQYVAKLPTPPAARAAEGFGADPPWTPAPKVDPWQPQVQPSVFPTDPTIPPQTPPAQPVTPTTPSVASGWIAVAWPLVGPAVVAGIAWLAYSYRAGRLAQGKQPLVDQATLDEVLALLKKVAASSSAPKS